MVPDHPGHAAAPPIDIGSADRALLRAGIHPDPHRLFRPVPHRGGTVVRALKPAAVAVAVRTDTDLWPLTDTGDGVFAAWVPAPAMSDYRLVVTYPGERTFVVADGYRLPPTVGPADLAAFTAGTHRHLWRVLGARPMHAPTPTGAVAGTAFTVWAPRAAGVAVVGDFDGWTGFSAPMRRLPGGVWEVFVPDVGPGALYKFRIRDRADPAEFRDRADPMARAAEPPPKTASIVAAEPAPPPPRSPAGSDSGDPSAGPMSVLEVHLGSWRIPGDYRRAAVELVGYAAELGFTHIELLPVAEHPYGGSWGYQITSYYAPTSRYGDPDGLRALIDACHRAGIGVLLDWVPAHFPRDGYALARFDGRPLYEPADRLLADHPDWGTLTFDYDRPEVRSFLASNARYWVEVFGVDGLRIDAVASMLYRDYSRPPGAWSPGADGGRENTGAIALLRAVTADLAGIGAVTIAEDSSDFPGATDPRPAGGLGFDRRWDLGWMHEVTAWFADPDPGGARIGARAARLLTDTAGRPRVLPIGHDEVVHGKGTPVTRMPGTRDEQIAGYRALLGLMFAWPGAKLLFMGQEYGQTGEWSEFFGLDWKQLRDPAHQQIRALVAELNRIYRARTELWAGDTDPGGAVPVAVSDPAVIALARRDSRRGPALVSLTNLGATPRTVTADLPVTGARWTVLLDTAGTGSGRGRAAATVADPADADSGDGAMIELSARSTVWLVPDRPDVPRGSGSTEGHR